MKSENLKLIKNLRHDLHKIPEPSMKEVETKKFLMDWIGKHTQNMQIVDKGCYFYVVYKVSDDKQDIAFRADMDALPIPEGNSPPPWASKNPGWSHKCGHDGHMAALCGLILEIDQKGCDNNCYFLFQPGEETAEGAVQCLNFFDDVPNINAFYAWHDGNMGPFTNVGIKKGPMFCASTGILLEFKGEPTHASTPRLGKSPVRAMMEVINAIPEFFDLWAYGKMPMCTICYVEAGTPVFGSAVGNGKLHLTCRAWYDKDMDESIENFINYALACGANSGIEVKATFHEKFASTENDPGCVDRVLKACEELKYPVTMLEDPIGGSEDFGAFLHHAPGCMWGMSFGSEFAPIHDKDFQFQDDVLEPAVELFKNLAYQKY
ncbi:MAG: amidohydrolase [Spirochaetaceae bacterium]|jgi:amidohydrolase|nr:amidohydrolase [Spirochaetaceae bacterium]